MLLVLVDRTGSGTHAAWCSRAHIGRAVAEMGGRRRPYSERHVSRWLLELRAAGWIDTKHRWHEDAPVARCTALRSLSPKLLDALGRMAGRRWRGRRQPAPAPTVERCEECGLPAPYHVTDEPRCSRAPPAG